MPCARTIQNRDRKRLRELNRALREEERQIQQGLRRQPTMTYAKDHHEVVALLESTSPEAKLLVAAHRGGATRRRPEHDIEMAEEFHSRCQASPQDPASKIVAEVGRKFRMTRQGAKKAIKRGLEILRRKAAEK